MKIMSQRKKCSKCLRTKTLSKFGKDIRYRLGVKCWCKSCEIEYGRTPKAKSRRKAYWDNKMLDPKYREYQRLRSLKKYHRNPRKVKDQNMRRVFGISLKMFERTKKCLICKRRVRLVADHNHETNKYRGALCITCNLMLGWIEQIPYAITKISKYLKRGV